MQGANDTEHNNTKHNDTCVMLYFYCNADCHFANSHDAECYYSDVIMLIVIMMSVV